MTKTPIEGAFQQYLHEIKKSVLKGDYTEMTLRTPLENFVRALNSDYDVTHEAKRIKKLGAPDFTAYRSGINVGYIEAKDLGKNLDEEIEGDQLTRYRESIDNIVLTDYRRFILIRGNQTIFDQSLFSLADLSNPKSHISDSKIDEFVQLLDTFFGYSQPTIKSAKVLAEELAKKTKLLKDLATEQLEEDLLKVESGLPPSSLYDFYETLNELIQDISVVDCADAFAQTITYGLFLAKISEKGTLDRDTAASRISRNIKIIRKFFSSIAGDALPTNVSWIVDALINILNASEVDAILSEIDFRGKKDRDPFTFFYEDFLALYEPEKKKHLGVYYTPRPVVSFIVKSVNQILKDDFDKPLGFAEEGLTVLDPAVGTGTFLWLIFLSTLVELKGRGLGGLIPSKIKRHILQDFYGFELLITPYIIAHLKLTTVLKRWFYEFEDDDRIQVYLTNTLEPFETHTHMPFFRELTEESERADDLKLKQPILVVLGNPPYSVSSANKSNWIMEKMKDYKKGLHERNIQPLDDDYIKFIRFAHWKVEQNGKGIVGLITNNSYLEGLIHRRMREELLTAFDHIYVLNLHGNSRRGERCPDGSKDENVFDIQQGVSITILVKNDNPADKKLLYVDLYGLREQKYEWLDRNAIDTTQWIELQPTAPHYFFVPKNLALSKEYNNFKALNEIFESYASGVKTHRDHFVVGFTTEELNEKADVFQSNLSDERVKEILNLKDTRDWSLNKARNAFKTIEYPQQIRKYAYRPLDFRLIAYSAPLLEYSREELMKNFYKPNIGLISVRQVAEDEIFSHVLVSDTIVDNRITSSNRGMSIVFPLYIYKVSKEEPQEKLRDEFKNHINLNKTPNFTEAFSRFIQETYQTYVTPEEVLGYIYALLYSPTYREIYNDLLKTDFPRINFVKDLRLFRAISILGEDLIKLHLMQVRMETTTTFPFSGDNVVKSVNYRTGRIYINSSQFFENVAEDVWQFQIAGHQVLDKWLKSRKGRELTISEVEHFLQIVEIIRKTIILMKEIDNLTLFS